MAEVYWIHLPEHTDMFKEGYVGFTSKNTKARVKQHFQAAERGGKYPVHAAIQKYKDRIIVETLVVGSNECCLEVELKLRPHKNTGWNLAVGGDAPLMEREHTQEFIDNLVARNKLGHSEETRKRMSESRKGTKASDEVKAKLSEMRKGEGNAFYGKSHDDDTRRAISEAAKIRLANPWDHPCANKQTWLMADDVHAVFVSNLGVKSTKLEKLVGLGKNKLIAMHAKFTQGWIPQEDPAWLQFKEQYLTEQTKNEQPQTAAAPCEP